MVGGYENIATERPASQRYQAMQRVAAREATWASPITGGSLATPSARTSSAPTSSTAASTARPGTTARTSRDHRQHDRPLQELLLLQRVQARPRTWSIDGYLNRLMRALLHPLHRGVPVLLLLRTPSLASYLGDDLLHASIDALNSLGEILQTPEPGLHCATAMSPDLLVLPDRRAAPNVLHQRPPRWTSTSATASPTSSTSATTTTTASRAPARCYEKLAALHRADHDRVAVLPRRHVRDANQYSINYYRIFKDQMLNLISGVIRNDPSTLRRLRSTTACYTATPVVDLDTYGKATYPPPDVHAVDHAARRHAREQDHPVLGARLHRWPTSTRPGTTRSTSRTTSPSRSRARTTT